MSRSILGFMAIMLTSLFWSMPATAMYSGDKKLACEATLCLAAGQRPSECNASIRKYFSIKFRKPWKTLRGRINFLKLCPTGQPSIATIIAKGAGQCEGKTLLDRLNPRVYIQNRGFNRPPIKIYRTYGARELPAECADFNRLRNVKNPTRHQVDTIITGRNWAYRGNTIPIYEWRYD